jgi:hypothetical protein
MPINTKTDFSVSDLPDKDEYPVYVLELPTAIVFIFII